MRAELRGVRRRTPPEHYIKPGPNSSASIAQLVRARAHSMDTLGVNHGAPHAKRVWYHYTMCPGVVAWAAAVACSRGRCVVLRVRLSVCVCVRRGANCRGQMRKHADVRYHVWAAQTKSMERSDTMFEQRKKNMERSDTMFEQRKKTWKG